MLGLVYEITLAGRPVDVTLYGDVSALTVEESVAGAGEMRLRLSAQRSSDGAWTYLDAEEFPLFTRITARIGYADGTNRRLATVFDGYLTDVDVELGGEPGDAFVVLTALDTSVLMSLEEKAATWPNMSDSDIATQIVGRYGVELQVDPTPTVHQEEDTTVAQRGTDLQFVRELARRNGREFYFETDGLGPRTAHFRAPQLSGTPQPDLAIQFGDASNLARFSAHLTAHRPLTVTTQQLDVTTNQTNSAQVNRMQLVALGARDANTVIGGPLDRVASWSDAPAEMFVLGTPTSDPTELRAVAQAVRDEAAWFITGTGEVNSDAYRSVLRPRRLVLIKGAGRQFSGIYYVTRVTHEITVNGDYRQTFDVRRNARDLLGSERFSIA